MTDPIRPVNRFAVDGLSVRVYDTREEMGIAAAEDTAQRLRKLLELKEEVRMIYAAAPSQNEMLAKLSGLEGIEWAKVVALHMDEYHELPTDAPQRFGNFLKERIFSKVPFKAVHYLSENNEPVQEAIDRYARLLKESPVDLVCMGIGENGHVAFNDPPVADFDDPHLVKVVKLDQVCRQQQVNDGAFASLGEVPKEAMTLTVPALMAGRALICVVPGKAKAEAIRKTLTGSIETACPASILRRHGDATLYLDRASASEIEGTF